MHACFSNDPRLIYRQNDCVSTNRKKAEDERLFILTLDNREQQNSNSDFVSPHLLLLALAARLESHRGRGHGPQKNCAFPLPSLE